MALREHARLYGTREEVAAALPVAFALTPRPRDAVASGTGRRDSPRPRRFAIAVDRYRETIEIVDPATRETMVRARGRDEVGPWKRFPDGAFVRLKPEEDDLAPMAWVLRRDYLGALASGHGRVSCEGPAGVEVRFEDILPFSPTLRFFGSKLNGLWWTSADGSRAFARLEGDLRVDYAPASTPWWPTEWYVDDGPALVVTGVEPAATTDLASPDRAAPFIWSGAPPAAFPLVLVEGTMIFRVGASLFAFRPGFEASRVSSSASIARAFHSIGPPPPPATSPPPPPSRGGGRQDAGNGLGASSLGFEGPAPGVAEPDLERPGALVDVAFGPDLRAQRLPALLVERGPDHDPLPGKMWDVVLGWGAVSDLVVRLDFAKGEISFAKEAPTEPAGALKTTFVLGDKPAFRAPPPAVTDIIAQTAEHWLPAPWRLAQCAAVAFDFPNRTFTLEPPCNRHERARVGWFFAPGNGDVNGKGPFTVAVVAPRSPADRAGVRAGDHLVEVAGRRSTTIELFDLLVLSEGANALERFPVKIERAGGTIELTIDRRTAVP